MKRLTIAILMVFMVLAFCSSCTGGVEIEFKSREGFFIYGDDDLTRTGSWYVSIATSASVNQKLANVVSKRFRKGYYIGTSVTDYVAITDSRVRFYDAATEGNELPKDYRLTDSMSIYIGFVD